MKKTPHQAMVLLLCRSADGVSFDSVKNALRVPVLSLRYERYSHCAPRGIVSALQRYSASDIITYAKDFCKLWNPKEGNSNVLRYFINVLDKADKDTSDNIQAKLDKLRNNKEKYDANIHLIFKALECVDCNNPIVEEVI